ncbi:MAG: hypothetical protein AAFV33_00190 [Chloroflexota bacterium]
MNQTMQLGGALLALLIALPLVSSGAGSSAFLWIVGLVLIVAGAVVPVYLRLHRGDSCQEKSKRRLWHRHRH